MSLDVYLSGEPRKEKCFCCECGNEYEKIEAPEYYSANITHNLATMADRAGIYYALWRPEEKGFVKAGQLIEPLTKGLEDMKARPDYFRQFNAENGWGKYKDFVTWVEGYLNACIENPEANIRVSR